MSSSYSVFYIISSKILDDCPEESISRIWLFSMTLCKKQTVMWTLFKPIEDLQTDSLIPLCRTKWYYYYIIGLYILFYGSIYHRYHWRLSLTWLKQKTENYFVSSQGKKLKVIYKTSFRAGQTLFCPSWLYGHAECVCYEALYCGDLFQIVLEVLDGGACA